MALKDRRQRLSDTPVREESNIQVFDLLDFAGDTYKVLALVGSKIRMQPCDSAGALRKGPDAKPVFVSFDDLLSSHATFAHYAG